MAEDIPEIKCDNCPNLIKSRNGETLIQLTIRAVIVERWKITVGNKITQCPDCVERQVRKASL